MAWDWHLWVVELLALATSKVTTLSALLHGRVCALRVGVGPVRGADCGLVRERNWRTRRVGRGGLWVWRVALLVCIRLHRVNLGSLLLLLLLVEILLLLSLLRKLRHLIWWHRLRVRCWRRSSLLLLLLLLHLLLLRKLLIVLHLLLLRRSLLKVSLIGLHVELRLRLGLSLRLWLWCLPALDLDLGLLFHLGLRRHIGL